MTQTQTDSKSKVQRLIARPNQYPWGKVGQDSLAARLSKNAAEDGFEIKDDDPYAELWMGTHPTNPSSLRSGSKRTLLSEHLSAHPDQLGGARRFPSPFTGKQGSGSEGQTEGHVPFLFKVLTCKQALPLQIHPDKELAKKLHEEDPEKYPDVNHKPEIAVCLSASFLGFAAFRPYEQIVSFLRTVPELASLSPSLQDRIGAFVQDPKGDTLRPVWEGFLRLSADEDVVRRFTARVEKEGVGAFSQLIGEGFGERDKENFVRAVKSSGKYYPGDGGLFSTLFFLNLVELKRGQGMYVGADGPHAWLEGEIVELMAISDNVLNVGFTPDEDKDDPSLVARAVTCTPKAPSELVLSAQPFSKSKTGATTVYSTPFEEFSILRIGGEDELRPFDGPGIAVVVQGTFSVAEAEAQAGGNDEQRQEQGSVWFIPAGTGTKWAPKSQDAEVWMAFYDAEAKKDEVGPK